MTGSANEMRVASSTSIVLQQPTAPACVPYLPWAGCGGTSYDRGTHIRVSRGTGPGRDGQKDCQVCTQ